MEDSASDNVSANEVTLCSVAGKMYGFVVCEGTNKGESFVGRKKEREIMSVTYEHISFYG